MPSTMLFLHYDSDQLLLIIYFFVVAFLFVYVKLSFKF